MTYLYVIERKKDCDVVKIGISDNVDARFKNLQASCPDPLEVSIVFRCKDRDDALRLERACHGYYNRNRIHGEWFNTEDMIAPSAEIGHNIFILAQELGLDVVDISFVGEITSEDYRSEMINCTGKPNPPFEEWIAAAFKS